MPIHYEQGDDHIVLITIDRPEAKNSADMEHFKQLREAWPEGEKFYQDYDSSRTASNVPAVITKEINAMLGLESQS